MWGLRLSQFVLLKIQVLWDVKAVLLGKKLCFEWSYCPHLLNMEVLLVCLTWRWRRYDPLKCPELLIQWQCNLPEGLDFQINYKSNYVFCILKKKTFVAAWNCIIEFVSNNSDFIEMYELWNLSSESVWDGLLKA